MTAFQLTPRAIAIVAGCIVALGGLTYVLHLRGQVAHAQAQTAIAQAQAAIFESQAKLNAAAAVIGEARDRNTAQAVSQAKEAEDDIEKSTDLDTAFAAYRSGVDSVRASGRGPLADPQPDTGGPNAGG